MSFEDVPYEFLAAVSHAERICYWQENISQDEMPPEWSWPFEDELSDWFEAIRLKREAPLEGGEEMPGGEWQQNDLAAGLRD